MLRIIAEYKPHIMLHENVLPFPLDMIRDILDEMYEFEQVILQPDIAGWPIERKRKYIIGRLRLKVKNFGLKKLKHIFLLLTFRCDLG